MGYNKLVVSALAFGFVLLQGIEIVSLLRRQNLVARTSIRSARELMWDADAPTINSTKKPIVNMLYGLKGNTTAFLDEWEVGLKSVLVNAPIDGDLHVHLICDARAHEAVQVRIQQAELIGSIWRNRITVTAYNVERYTEEWTDFVTKAIRNNGMDGRVTLGGYYRLLAHRVLPPNTGPVFYMDTDSLVMVNLNDLWQHVNDEYIYQWSATTRPCSGAMILNADKMHRFWQRLDSLEHITHGGDQSLLVMVANAFPNETGQLPAEWDTHLGHGWRPYPHKILDSQKTFGMLHFNGQRKRNERFWDRGLEHYCSRTKGCNRGRDGKEKFAQSWGLADYYVRLTWPMVKYLGGTSQLPLGFNRTEGYPLLFNAMEA